MLVQSSSGIVFLSALLLAYMLSVSMQASQPIEILEILEQPLGPSCAAVSNDKKRVICKCNEYICDSFQNQWPRRKGEAFLIETTRSGLRYKATRLAEKADTADNDHSISEIVVDLNSERQSILGFGGAFTDAATININSLTKPVADRLLQSYFGPEGLQYNLGRVPIAGSDFSERAYSYDDANYTDYALDEWKLAPEDLEHKIPIIKQAMELVKQDGGQELKLIATPWSPPVWMKSERDFRPSHLLDDDKIYQAWANYLLKFYDSYKEHGINFWGATLQNEPLATYLPFYFFNGLRLSEKEAARLVTKFLGPALVAKGYTKENFKLLVGDDSLLFVNQQAPALLRNEEVKKYVSGLAYHWYTSGLVAPYSSLGKLIDQVKDEVDYVVMTEACNGAMTVFSEHVDLGNWNRGEAYAMDIIEDMRRHTNAWIDWNLALDQRGGPNWAGNFADSPIIVNKANNEFYKQPMYYVLGHFSRFFRPNSIVVDSELKNPGYFEKVMTLAAHKKDTSHVIVNILNKAASVRTLKLRLLLKQGNPITLGPFNVEGKSINTILVSI